MAAEPDPSSINVLGEPAAVRISPHRVDEDLALGAGRVVLGQLGDLLEELRTALVVEVLRRQLLRLGGQPGAYLVGHLGTLGAGVVDLDLDPVGRRGELHLPASLAQRRPANIWRRWGRSQLRKLGRATLGWVAQEPPRSTRCSSPKKTSEYSG